MNKLILCEGETDAILLSYYLGKVAGWEYNKRAPRGLDIKDLASNQTANWYRKNDDNLLICAVGGKDNFKNFFEEKIKETLLLRPQNTFERLAFVMDRDDNETQTMEESAASALESISAIVENNKWRVCRYEDCSKREKTLDVLLIVIPKERQGALETAMLDAIAENEYDGKIVKKTKEFAKQMRVEASKYISSDRLELKARLGLTWAVQYPDNVFTRIDKQIKNVRWEESDSLRSCFSKLIEI